MLAIFRREISECILREILEKNPEKVQDLVFEFFQKGFLAFFQEFLWKFFRAQHHEKIQKPFRSPETTSESYWEHFQMFFQEVFQEYL